MAQVNIRNLDETTYEALKAQAGAEDVSVTEITRRAIAAYCGPVADMVGKVVEADAEMARCGVPLRVRERVCAVLANTVPKVV